MAHVIDRWHAVSPETGRKRKTDRYGVGLRWQVEYVSGDGKKRRKSFAYRELADKFCTDMQAEKHRGVYRRGTGRETFREVAQAWLDAQIHLREQSHDAARIRLENTVYPSIGDRETSALTQADIQGAVASWALDYAPSTVRLAYGYTSSVFAFAVSRELIPKSPCVKIRLPREHKGKVVPLSDDAVSKIASTVRPHLEALVWLVAATGMRGGEARSLTWDRVKAGRIDVDRQISKVVNGAPVFGPLKTEYSNRAVSVGPAVAAMLEEHRRLFGVGPDGLVFRSLTGAPLVRSHMSAAWRTARKRVPQAGSGWHQLRHYHASKLIAAGLSPVAVAHRLGHKDATETLETYSHLWPSDDAIMSAQGDAIVAPVMGGNVVSLNAANA